MPENKPQGTQTTIEVEPAELTEPKREERRTGPPDRRTAGQDRRNLERLAGDIAPRRNPEVPDRRRKR